MNDKITKLILGGKEYLITDKQAQQILDILSNKVETLENRVDELDDKLTWKVTR